jgi:hypothetical protein
MNCGYIVVVGRDGGVVVFVNQHTSAWTKSSTGHWLHKQQQRVVAFVKLARAYMEYVSKRETEWLAWKVIRHLLFSSSNTRCIIQ